MFAIAGLAAGASGSAFPMTPAVHHFACHLTSTERVDHLGTRGADAELTHFKCIVTGGLLDGFVAVGTQLWDAPTHGTGTLLAWVLVAHKGASSVVSELEHGMRTPENATHVPASWRASAQGTYKFATGSAAALAGRSFSAVSLPAKDGAFTIEAVVTD